MSAPDNSRPQPLAHAAPATADPPQGSARDREVAELRAVCDELRRVCAAERVQLAQSFELFERDRRMLGFEIHDGLVQDLTAALMFLQAGLHQLHEGGVAPPAPLAESERIVVRCIESARRLIAGLQPPQLSEFGLVAAIEALAQDARDRGIPQVDVQVERSLGNLAPPLEMAAYRVIQESLNNVWQHSQAPRASVSLTVRDEQLHIEVSDNGRGFDTTRADRHHYGLIGIRERATLFGGVAVIESAPGHGATVHVTLPLQVRAAVAAAPQDVSSRE